MKKINKKYLITGIILIVLGFVVFRTCSSKKPQQYEFETAAAEVTTIKNSITATGTIEPVTKVTVGTQVSGIVSHLYVDYNSVVKKGQVIAELDRTNLTSELNSANANLNSSTAEYNYQKSNYERYKTLFEKGLVSAEEYESAKLSYDRASQSVSTARENVRKAQTNLSYATITSPIDGIVLSKSVEEGQTVAASFNTPELFTIAQDLTNMRVIANVDEADIADVRNGERVLFTVDAYPESTFEGTVSQVRQSATTTNNVVTYEVVISAPNADLKLKPGLTANVTIYTMEKPDVLAVSSKAIRFTPNDEMLREGGKIIDCEGKAKVWIEDGLNIKAIPVTTGVTNGVETEILSGIKAGDKVIVGFSVVGGFDDMDARRSPFMPGPPRRK